MTVWPLRSTVRRSPLSVMTNRFHWPGGLSALTLGMAPDTDLGGHLLVGPVAVHFAGADGVAGDVDLRLAEAAEQDAAVARVGDVERLAASRRGSWRRRRWGGPPAGDAAPACPGSRQSAISTKLPYDFLGPEVLVLGLALAVVGKDEVLGLPVAGVARVEAPAAEVESRVERDKARVERRGLLLAERFAEGSSWRRILRKWHSVPSASRQM